jgi:hypothetical protein
MAVWSTELRRAIVLAESGQSALENFAEPVTKQLRFEGIAERADVLATP